MVIRTLQVWVRLPYNVSGLPHDRSELLFRGGTPSKVMIQSMDSWIQAMVIDEHGGGGGSDLRVTGRVLAKDEGVIAGTFVVDRLIELHFPACEILWNSSEGDTVSRGDRVLEISGPSSQVLRCERILLNLLGRMSGVATNTSTWASEAPGIEIACTRKTDWGLLDKWAVHIGGGLTHRLSRGDALMIKENDLASLAPGVSDECTAVGIAVGGIDMDHHAEFVVVEVRDECQALVTVRKWDEMQVDRGGCEKIVLLLDNMGPESCLAVHSTLVREGLREWCLLEGSGGIVFDSLEKWKDSGVDLISTSALNRGAPPLDLTMMVEEVVE